jgi:hypothetical protein
MMDWLTVNGIDVYGSYHGIVAICGSSSADGHAGIAIAATQWQMLRM